mgnify:CR=1 FL=1
MEKMTIFFEDRGQDFLEWDLEDMKVVAVRPFQAFVWVGQKLIGTPKVGKAPSFLSAGEVKTMNYKLVKIARPRKVRS